MIDILDYGVYNKIVILYNSWYLCGDDRSLCGCGLEMNDTRGSFFVRPKTSL